MKHFDESTGICAALLTESEIDSNCEDAVERRDLLSSAARRLVQELRAHQTELLAQNGELREAQEDLKTMNSRYFDLYELAPVGYCTISESNKVLSANRTAAVLLGVDNEELVGKPIQRFIAPVDQDNYYLHCKRLFEAGKPQSCELRLVRPDRSQFWAELIATFALDASGIGVHRIVLTDIDERRTAQDKIRISDSALKAVSQGVIIKTPDMRVVDANEAILSMTGYSPEELSGVNCSVFYGPLTDTAMIEEFRQAVRANKTFSGEMVYYRKDGSCFWNALALSPVFDPKGNLSHFISIHTDITERRRIDQVLKDSVGALKLATELAEKANQAKSDFLSSMSHELRSPLNSILGFAQLLASGTPSPTPLQSKNIDKILGGGWYLLTLINDILDLALIESGKLALSLEPLSLGNLLTGCQIMVEPQAGNRGIVVKFPSMRASLQVVADPTRLTQVLVNLLSNAIKYNRPNGGVRVSVITKIQGTVRIEIKDTGEGLSADKLAQLFQPFNRLGKENSTTEGTGIGLVVAKRLTELMGGTIGVRSTVGVGSVFWVQLPIAKSETEKKVAWNSLRHKQPTRHLQHLSNCTVLYVEDNPANVELVSQILQARPNLQLIVADNARQGIEMAHKHAPQIILMDINLPGMSGLEALKVLKQDAGTRQIPVLAVTANALPIDAANGMAAGFCQYLTKPFKIDEFLQSMDQALEASKSRAYPD